MANRRTRALQYLPAAIVEENPARVTTRVLRVLRELLGNPSIQFEETTLANNEVKYSLSGTYTRGTARDRYTVFPLLQEGEELFWLGSYLIFRRELGLFRLLSVSLIIFKGEALDERKTALLRAEWDNDMGTLHAQPHWHVYTRSNERDETDEAIIEDLNLESVEESLDNREPHDHDPDWPTSTNFHYAMASRWHASSDLNLHQVSLDNVDSLLTWIKGCVTYCRGQLSFLFS